MTRLGLAFTVFMFCRLSTSAQLDEVRAEFEVASVKPSPADSRGVRFAALPGGRLSVRNNALLNLLFNAYDVRNFQLTGLPGWAESERYDIEAKAPGNPSRAQIMQMLQALLMDRFKLKVHRETKELPIFVLTAAKSGIKLQPWKEGSCTVVEPGRPLPPPAPGQQAMRSCGNNIVLPKGPNMEWNATKIDMARVTMVLSSILRQSVVDNTGYTGTFDLHLEWSRDESLAPISGGGEPGDSGRPPADSLPSIFTLLQRQLGLKLETSKGPVEVLVIDHVEKPSEN